MQRALAKLTLCLKLHIKLKKQGIDIVVGYIERHTRPDTLALLEGLEQLPNKEIDYKGIKLKEFDLDAALKRHPQIVLVDELAHSNVVGSRHAKRYQDVEELLRASMFIQPLMFNIWNLLMIWWHLLRKLPSVNEFLILCLTLPIKLNWLISNQMI